MSPQRPNFIDLRAPSSMSNVSRPLRSPRLHVAGEAPPELSPLDAFALQSRLLARQLQAAATGDGRRMSRLPPLTTESPLVVQGRSDYFRSLSNDSGSEDANFPELQNPGLGLRTEMEDAFPSEKDRPRSVHPRMSRIPPTPDESIPLPPQPQFETLRGRPLDSVEEPHDDTLFGARREQSPAPMEHAQTAESHVQGSPARNDLAIPLRSPARSRDNSLTSSPGKPKGHSFDGPGLAPPRPNFVARSPTSMSSPLDNATDDAAMSNSVQSLPPRKLSSSSAFAMSNASPGLGPGPFQRSPSVSSEASMALPRPSFNFSRPMSRAGTPGLETPTRQASSDSQPSFVFANDDSANTPVSMNSEGFPEMLDDGKAAPSYIYSTYDLPRGKVIQRSVPLDSQPQASGHWEQPMAHPNNVQPIHRGAPPSPPTRPSSSAEPGAPNDLSLAKPDIHHGGPAPQPSPNPSRPSTESRASEEDPRGRALTSPVHDGARVQTAMSMATTDSSSTLKAARSQASGAPTTSDMTPEEHLAKGIECHENGSVKESTYHLRHAAKGGNPTGMLLYALACRHGWGMRPNQREGVEWLRKAAECASLEIADDEDHAKEGKFVDAMERRTRKAQFALSIYELGVSHMNGWGIEQDKALALRCFEIAGSWGDVDALAEAGFCYAQGMGCKKDLKKAAGFYRQAEAKGMNMVGNSWIHKAKYNDDDKDAKKTRSKSRTRHMFGIKTG
ncbi:cell cycle inhibitor [Colletotrichum plurivorum]|uniref:Cell cycle inhibitor n=1 Tax=Colletotrichum plurivorum TaxID=2175906 RepID=A0A8H6U618_9PEZI|nr:cell cycle inhibitor [Colletotrichum plurivorum]